jgi:hypothetical protein
MSSCLVLGWGVHYNQRSPDVNTMSRKKLTPADLVIRRFGGVRPLARELGKNPSTVSLWTSRHQGKIPNRSANGDPKGTHVRLLELAKRKSIPLTADELINGGYA